MAVIIALMLIALGTPITRSAAAKAPTQYFSPVTNQILAQPFLKAWADGGAFDVYGEPVTAPVVMGKRAIQFFEYGALSVREGRESDPQASVTRVAIGTELLELLAGTGRLVAGRRSGNSHTPVPDTASSSSASNSSGKLDRFYEENGGAARFGRSLGQTFNATVGSRQWYEYGRLELRPDGGVRSAPVGIELATKLGIISPPAERGNLPLLSAKRFHSFAGDGTVPEESGPFAPVRIMIPSIQVDAKIEQIDIVNGVMGTPVDAWNVGWYHQLSSPGQWTNVVMAGHLDWWGIGPTVFYHLDQVQRGDRIYLVDRDGNGATYQVVRNYAVDANANPNPIVNDAGIEMLTLITCGGNFDGSEYLSRQIVRAKRI